MNAFVKNLKSFAVDHDDAPAFHAAYFVLTILVSVLLNVGAFALLVGAHAGLDLYKYRDRRKMRWGRAWIYTLRESLLDLFLLALALCVAVYFHHSAGIVAVSGLFHLEESLVRGFALLVPRLEILWHVLAVFGNIRLHLQQKTVALHTWKTAEYCTGAGLCVCLLLLLCAPLVLHDSGVVAHVIIDQLVPWRA